MKGERMDLFEEFDPVSTEAWEERVRKDLKGREPESLNRVSHEGLVFRLINRKPETEPNYPDPGLAPFRRGSHISEGKPAFWRLHHVLDPEKTEDAYAWLSKEFSHISAGIRLDQGMQGWGSGLKDPSWEMLGKLYQLCHHNEQDLFIEAGVAAPVLAAYWLDSCESAGIRPSGGADIDPASLAGTGAHAAENFDRAWKQALPVLSRNMPAGFRPIRVGLQDAYARGAGVITQTALALSMLVEYADRAESIPLNPDNFFRLCWVEFPIDTDFFAEIARLRAFRVLYHRLLSAYGLSDEEIAGSLYVAASGSELRFSALDRHTNLLRATTEAMSAAFGGADRISVPAFDAALKHSDKHAHMLAHQLQLILMLESGLEDVADPAGGSWLVEDLTDQIIDKAWALFLEIEGEGGYYAALKSGSLNARLEKLRASREKDVNTGKETLVGVNQYPNLMESTLPEKKTPMRGNVSPITSMPTHIKECEVRSPREWILSLHQEYQTDNSPERLSARFERIRFRTEEAIAAGQARPQALMCMFGDGRMRRARAQFAANLLGVAGITTVEQYVESPEALDPVSPEYSLVMLCASDEDYTRIAAEFIQELDSLNPGLPVYVAGKPAEPGSWGEDGHFALGMDRAEWLEALQEKIMNRKEERHEA